MKKKTLLILALCLLIPTTAALANGNFSYVTIDGPGLTNELNITDPALTSDFYVFADFTKGPIDPPANPGEGYEITRVYIETVDDKPTAKAFDQLLYFPYVDEINGIRLHVVQAGRKAACRSTFNFCFIST